MKEDNEKITVTLGEETLEWLRENYPDSLSDQEALRMAVSDARHQHSDLTKDVVNSTE
jgi:hypothetical protein